MKVKFHNLIMKYLYVYSIKQVLQKPIQPPTQSGQRTHLTIDEGARTCSQSGQPYWSCKINNQIKFSNQNKI